MLGITLAYPNASVLATHKFSLKAPRPAHCQNACDCYTRSEVCYAFLQDVFAISAPEVEGPASRSSEWF